MISQKLKLALLSVHSCPVGNLGGKDSGGMNVYVRELAHQLGKQGHLVDVYTRVHDPNDPQIVEIGENARLIHLKAGAARILKNWWSIPTCLISSAIWRISGRIMVFSMT